MTAASGLTHLLIVIRVYPLNHGTAELKALGCWIGLDQFRPDIALLHFLLVFGLVSKTGVQLRGGNCEGHWRAPHGGMMTGLPAEQMIDLLAHQHARMHLLLVMRLPVLHRNIWTDH